MPDIPPPALLSPKSLTLANEILAWVKDNITIEKPDDVKRPYGNQMVCPFVGPSIDKDRFYMALHPEVRGNSLDQAKQIVLGYVKTFGTSEKPSISARTLGKAG